MESKPPASVGFLQPLDEPVSSSQMPPMEPSLVNLSWSRGLAFLGGTPREHPHSGFPLRNQGGKEAHHRGSTQRAARLPTGLANCALIVRRADRARAVHNAGRVLQHLTNFPGLPGCFASLSCSGDICSVPVPPMIPCPLQLCRPPALCGVP